MIALSPILNTAAIGLALLILWRVEPALSRMDSDTHWMIRYAMLLLAGGALGTLFTICNGSNVDPITLIVLAGIALLLFCERRISYLIRIRKGGRHA